MIFKEKQQYMQEWYRIHPEYNRKYCKDWHNKNKEKDKIYQKEYYTKNKSKLSLYAIKYQQTHKDNVKQYKKEYRKIHKGYIKIQRKKYNYLKRNAGDLPIKRIQKIYEDNIKKYGTLTCYLCFKPIKFGKDSIDHKTPLSRGGDNEYINLGVTHIICNLRKHTRTEKEYRNWLIKKES